ncbi:MAG: ATP-binding protein, partial [Clostridiales bacterium]|nr:ATP-binding protein [Clostridiales bacterium]
MRRFNVTGLCVPEEDYMVDISGKLEQIIKLIDSRSYFTINRARQYGKTTTLSMLRKRLAGDYICVRISFEGIGDEDFASPDLFCRMFVELVHDSLQFTNAPTEYRDSWLNDSISNFRELSKHITKMCKDKKVVLMIDEVDKTSNNRIFLHFLGMLRDKFLARKDGMDFTFHSAILVGVYDIKNIKLKMKNEGTYSLTAEESKIYNSPWNIA